MDNHLLFPVTIIWFIKIRQDHAFSFFSQAQQVMVVLSSFTKIEIHFTTTSFYDVAQNFH